MKHITARGATVAVLGLLLGACQTEPVYEAKGHPIVQLAQSKMSDEQMVRIIGESIATVPNWQIEETTPGRIRAKWRRHQTRHAICDILYNKESFSILLVSSVELYQKDGVIHPSFNGAVRNLENEIDRRVVRLGY